MTRLADRLWEHVSSICLVRGAGALVQQLVCSFKTAEIKLGWCASRRHSGNLCDFGLISWRGFDPLPCDFDQSAAEFDQSRSGSGRLSTLSKVVASVALCRPHVARTRPKMCGDFDRCSLLDRRWSGAGRTPSRTVLDHSAAPDVAGGADSQSGTAK